MIKGHWDLVLVALVGVAVFLFACWLLDTFLISLDKDLADAHNYDESQEHLRNVITESRFHEIVDPYVRINALENEVHGYLVQIEQLKEVIFSHRQNLSSVHQHGESGLGGAVTTEGLNHSSPIDDSQDCA